MDVMIYAHPHLNVVLLISHYNDITMGSLASQITSLTIVYSAVYSGADQRKHQSSASLAIVRGIHRGPMNSPHKWAVMRKVFPFDDIIMCQHILLDLDLIRVTWRTYAFPDTCPSTSLQDHSPMTGHSSGTSRNSLEGCQDVYLVPNF